MVKGAKSKKVKKIPKRDGLFLFVALVLILVSFGVSVELTQIHYFTHTDPSYESVCAVSDEMNCETVAQSPYSVYLGVPVSVWGMFAYFFMALFAAWGMSSRRLHSEWPQGILLGLFSLGLLSSSALAYISLTRIDSICLFCTSLYVLNGLLFVIFGAFMVVGRKNPFRLIFLDLQALLGNLPLFLILILGAAGLVLGFTMGIPEYWHHPGWSDLPELETGQDEKGCHWIGARKPLVTVIEFSDYECPHCRRAHKKMRAEAARYPDKVRLIHNHLPLDHACNEDVKRPFHNRACEFSKAAECAAEQDRFWAMNDAIFSIQDTVRAKDVDIERIAVQLGLDRSAFKSCMAEDGVPECIKDDMEKARRMQVAGTPTFFAGNQPYPGGLPDGLLDMLVQSAEIRPAGAEIRPAGAEIRPAGAEIRPAGAEIRPAEKAPVPANSDSKQ